MVLQDSSGSSQLQTMTKWFKKLYLSSFESFDAEWNGDFSSCNIKSMTWTRARELELAYREKMRVGFTAAFLIFQQLSSVQQWYEEYDLLDVLVTGRILLGGYGIVLLSSEYFP